MLLWHCCWCGRGFSRQFVVVYRLVRGGSRFTDRPARTTGHICRSPELHSFVKLIHFTTSTTVKSTTGGRGMNAAGVANELRVGLGDQRRKHRTPLCLYSDQLHWQLLDNCSGGRPCMVYREPKIFLSPTPLLRGEVTLSVGGSGPSSNHINKVADRCSNHHTKN